MKKPMKLLLTDLFRKIALLAVAVCPFCDGLGLIRSESGSRPCSCQREAEAKARMNRARIPPGFAPASFLNFKRNTSNARAQMVTESYAREFVPGDKERKPAGLLLVGSVGVGKTHLAVSILRELIQTKGIEGRFVDMVELLDQLRGSYSNSLEDQREILRPIFNADLVVLDELGAARPSDWVFETLELLIGGLYNRNSPVIVTTNLPNLPPLTGPASEYLRATRRETLGDRIGIRMWSRLQQMCMAEDLSGPDWRTKA
jgi:DNA replication protein DnaC